MAGTRSGGKPESSDSIAMSMRRISLSHDGPGCGESRSGGRIVLQSSRGSKSRDTRESGPSSSATSTVDARSYPEVSRAARHTSSFGIGAETRDSR